MLILLSVNSVLMHLTEPTIIITPTSSTKSEDYDTTPSETRTSEKGASSTGNSNIVDTGYDRFIRRHCQWRQLFHSLK
jgi:hypothetical protein